MTTLVDGLNASLHLLPLLAYRPFLSKQLIHKAVLLKGVEAKDLVIHRYECRHLPLILLQKQSELLRLLPAANLVELYEVDKAVVDF